MKYIFKVEQSEAGFWGSLQLGEDLITTFGVDYADLKKNAIEALELNNIVATKEGIEFDYDN